MPKFFITAAFLFIIHGAKAQFLQPIAARFDNLVLIEWATEAGFTCNNMEVQHGTDSLVFKTIYIEAGICGDPQTQKNYNCTHLNPAQRPIDYYKITSTGSAVSQIFRLDNIIFGNRRFMVYPQPAHDYIFINFDNPTADDFLLKISDLHGKIYAKIPIKDIQIARFDTFDLPNGVYVFELSSEKRIFTDKFWVIHP